MKKENNGKLRIIPLGGLEKIGMNITAFEYEDSIIVVDCGLAFPEDDMLGIDLVIPDITYLKDNIQKVKGFVITHGHEDHIGALSYVLREMNLPIYATKLTMGIIEKKLTEHNLLRSTRRKSGKIWTVYQSGTVPDRVYQDKPQYPGCVSPCQSTPRQVSWYTQETLRWITHRSSEMPLTCKDSVRSVKRACLLLCQTVTNAERPDLPVRENGGTYI